MNLKIKHIRNTLLLALVACNLSCDQISKEIARNQIEYGQRINVIEGFFTLTKIENSGAFLSLGQSLPEALRFVILILFPSLLLAYGLYYLLSKRQLSLKVAVGIGFAIGGGIGNLYDRWKYGSVTDFMHMNLGIFQTGIFNFADVSIMVGVGLIFLSSLLEKKQAETSD